MQYSLIYPPPPLGPQSLPPDPPKDPPKDPPLCGFPDAFKSKIIKNNKIEPKYQTEISLPMPKRHIATVTRTTLFISTGLE